MGSPVYVCICHAVSESELDGHIAAGARTEREIGARCGAGTGCGSCVERICAKLRSVDPLHGCDAAPALAS